MLAGLLWAIAGALHISGWASWGRWLQAGVALIAGLSALGWVATTVARRLARHTQMGRMAARHGWVCDGFGGKFSASSASGLRWTASVAARNDDGQWMQFDADLVSLEDRVERAQRLMEASIGSTTHRAEILQRRLEILPRAEFLRAIERLRAAPKISPVTSWMYAASDQHSSSLRANPHARQADIRCQRLGGVDLCLVNDRLRCMDRRAEGDLLEVPLGDATHDAALVVFSNSTELALNALIGTNVRDELSRLALRSRDQLYVYLARGRLTICVQDVVCRSVEEAEAFLLLGDGLARHAGAARS